MIRCSGLLCLLMVPLKAWRPFSRLPMPGASEALSFGDSMNYRTRDKIDFGLFCLWFYTVGLPYLSAKTLYRVLRAK
jgi:hypothetical protein